VIRFDDYAGPALNHLGKVGASYGLLRWSTLAARSTGLRTPAGGPYTGQLERAQTRPPATGDGKGAVCAALVRADLVAHYVAAVGLPAVWG